MFGVIAKGLETCLSVWNQNYNTLGSWSSLVAYLIIIPNLFQPEDTQRTLQTICVSKEGEYRYR